MKINKANHSQEPLFPEFLYTADMELTPAQTKKLLDVEHKMPRTVTKWGWTREKHPYSPEIKSLAKLLGTKCYDILTYHYAEGKKSNHVLMPDGHEYLIEVTTMNTMSILPDHAHFISAHERGRVFLGLLYLQCDKKSHQIHIHNQKTQHASFDNHLRVVTPGLLKFVLLPGNVPINLVPQGSSESTILHKISFTFKR